MVPESWEGVAFKDRVFMCSHGWPGSYYMAQAGLELVAVLLPLLYY